MVVVVTVVGIVVVVVVLRLLVELWVGEGRRVSMCACIVIGVRVGVRVSVWLRGDQGLGGGCVPASFAAPTSHLLVGCCCYEE